MTNLARVGVNRDPLHLRKDDLYETPECATETLCREYRLPRRIWEPACGRGAIARVLEREGHEVECSDLVDYGLDGAAHGVDFLMETRAPDGITCIVTNPPFKLANEFVRKAIDLVPVTIMLLRLAYLEGAGRSDVLDNHLSDVLVGVERLPMMHRDGWEGPRKSNAAQPFAWFVFTQTGPVDHSIRLRRVSWRSA